MIYTFGNCALNAHEYTLYRSGSTIPLAPKVFALLLYLIQHRGHVVSKQELFDHAWNDTDPTDAALNYCVMQARRAIGDDGDAQQYIQTVRGLGYRFLHKVEECATIPSEPPEATPTPWLPPPSDWPSSLSPFLGRDRELHVLHTALTQVAQGHGQVITLSGEAGMGKSRLVAEFQHQLRAKNVICLTAYCLPYGQTQPYLPVRALLQQLCGLSPEYLQEITPPTLATRLCEWALNPVMDTPYILHLLNRCDSLCGLNGIHAAIIRLHTFDLLRHMFVRAGQQRLLVVVIEDVHWIDKTSEAWLTALLANLTNTRILFLLTCRPEYQPGWPECAWAQTLRLAPLAADSSRTLLQATLPPHHFPEPVVSRMIRHAHGLPWWLEQMPRVIAEQSHSAVILPVPDTLEAALRLCLRGLSKGALRVLQGAAVIAQPFSLALVSIALEQQSAVISNSLGELQRRRLCIQETPESPYAIRHALVQEAVYNSLSTRARHWLHRQVGKAIETVYADRLADMWEGLAYHYARGQQPGKAIHYALQAAERAITHYAHYEAHALLQYARQYNVPELSEHARASSHGKICFQVTRSLHALGESRQVRQMLQAKPWRLLRQQDIFPPGQEDLLYSHIATQGGEWQQALEHAQHALTQTNGCQESATSGQAHHIVAMANYWLGNPQTGAAHSQQAIDKLSQAGERTQLGVAYFVLGLNQLMLGHFAAALEAERKAAQIGEVTYDQQLQSCAAWAMGWLHATRGDWQEAFEACQQSHAQARDPLNATCALGWCGYTYLEKGESAAAMPLLQRAIDHLQRYNAPRLQGLYTVFLAAAYLAQQNLTQASAVASEALEIVASVQYRAGIAHAQRVLGHIALAGGNHDTARDCLHTAVELFHTMGARFEEGRTHLLRAELTAHHANRTLAAEPMAQALALFRSLELPLHIEQTVQRAHTLGLECFV